MNAVGTRCFFTCFVHFILNGIIVLDGFSVTPPFVTIQTNKNILSLGAVSFNNKIASNDTNAIIFEEPSNISSSVYVSIVVSPSNPSNRKTQHENSKHGRNFPANKKNKKAKTTATRKASATIQEDLLSQEVQEINKKYEQHKKHMKQLDNLPCLVLNADYQPLSFSPISVWTWQETAKAILCYSNKVTVVDVYSDVYINANNFTLPLPSVIAMNDYIPTWRRKRFRRVAFSRRNVYIRDGYTCQYCNKQYQGKELSFDHVIPRCKGGRLTWSNVVTCCRQCNTKKGSMVVHELHKVGMKLQRKPYVPSIHELAIKAEKLSLASARTTKIVLRYHDSWVPFLGAMITPRNNSTA